MIEGHGDDAWKYRVPIRADFSSNVWYGELDRGLLEHLQEKVATVTHYPEAGASSVQKAAAEIYDVTPDQLLVTNGATEAIYLITQVYRQMKATVLTPAFAEYADACRLQGMDLTFRRTVGSIQGLKFGEEVVFLCNPNNPTGQSIPVAELQEWAARNWKTLFVVDESYIEFTHRTSSLLPLIEKFHNVLVLRSLTKSNRIPGLRIGFVIGDRELIRRLRTGMMPWSVNRLAIEAGLYIFHHYPAFKVPVEELLTRTAAWQSELREATGWHVHDTDTHYFLMETPSFFTAAALKLHLVSRHGLLIRDAANFEGLTARHFRIACQSPDHNRFLTEALQLCSQTGL